MDRAASLSGTGQQEDWEKERDAKLLAREHQREEEASPVVSLVWEQTREDA